MSDPSRFVTDPGEEKVMDLRLTTACPVNFILIPDSLLVQRRNDTVRTNNLTLRMLFVFLEVPYGTLPKVAFLRGEKNFKNVTK